MTKSEELAPILLVHKHATPLAALLILMGVLLSPLDAGTRLALLAMAFVSVAFNVLVVRQLQDKGVSPRVLQIRMALNFVVNCILVYVLLPHWEPVWLLLLLTPLATAVYGNEKETLTTALGSSLQLLALTGLRWASSDAVAWGNQLAYAATIMLLSSMARRAFAEKGAAHRPDRE